MEKAAGLIDDGSNAFSISSCRRAIKRPITYYSTVAERQQKTAKLRASCGSSGIEIRVSPWVISGGFFFATAARGLSTIAATRTGQSQGQATKVAMLGSRDYVTR
jgi:hypothetical protein